MQAAAVVFIHCTRQVWLNHRPLSLRPLPSSATKQLLPPLPSLAISLKHDLCISAVANSSYAPQTFSFGPTGVETQLTLPLPNDVAGAHSSGQSLSIRCASRTAPATRKPAFCVTLSPLPPLFPSFFLQLLA